MCTYEGRIVAIDGQLGLCSGGYLYHLKRRGTQRNGFATAILTGKSEPIDPNANVRYVREGYMIQARLSIDARTSPSS